LGAGKVTLLFVKSMTLAVGAWYYHKAYKDQSEHLPYLQELAKDNILKKNVILTLNRVMLEIKKLKRFMD
jgi:hypothetical protein